MLLTQKEIPNDTCEIDQIMIVLGTKITDVVTFQIVRYKFTVAFQKKTHTKNHKKRAF